MAKMSFANDIPSEDRASTGRFHTTHWSVGADGMGQFLIFTYQCGVGSLGPMARRLRVEYPGAVYLVMSRSDRRERIFRDDADRQRFVNTLGEACGKTARCMPCA